MDNNVITRSEHEEFSRRLDEEAKRLRARLDIVERTLSDMRTLTISVERLATNMESMLKEMDSQGKRLAKLEGRDGEKWRIIITNFIIAIVMLLVGLMVKGVVPD